MDDIERIKWLRETEIMEKEKDHVMNLYKALQVNLGKLTLNKNELKSLITYFEDREEYEICKKLNKFK
jgi:uncharacterized membrane protein YvbJ